MVFVFFKVITRMVFGSFPMLVSNRTAIKVHSLKSTNKTMISNVFTYYNNNHFSNTKNSTLNCYCNNKSSSSNNNIAGSIPISNSSKIPKTNCKIVTSTEPSSPVDHIKPSDMTKQPDWKDAVTNLHNPHSGLDLEASSVSRSRLAYDELLANQLSLALVRMKQRRVNGRSFVPTGALRKKLMAAVE